MLEGVPGEADDGGQQAPLLTNSWRRRQDAEMRLFQLRLRVNSFVRVAAFVLLLSMTLLLLLLYVNLRRCLGISWWGVVAPGFVALLVWVARSSCKLMVLPPRELRPVYASTYGTRPMESHIRSISITMATFVALVLVCCRLEGITKMEVVFITLPVSLCLVGFVCLGVFNVFLRGDDAGLSPEQNRNRRTSMRLELIMFSLSLLTVLLGSFRLDGKIDVSWFLILSWPIIVLSGWAIAAIGLTFVAVGWMAATCRNGIEELDDVLEETLEGSYRRTPMVRMFWVSAFSSFVLIFNTAILSAFVSLFSLINLLNGTISSLDPVFVPVIISLLLVQIYSLIVFALIQQMDPGSSQTVAIEDGSLRPIKPCFTCRKPVERLVNISDPNIRLIDELNEEQPDCSVCMQRKADAVFLPCGHGGICTRCAQKWTYGMSAEDASVSENLREALDSVSTLETPIQLLRQSQTYFKL